MPGNKLAIERAMLSIRMIPRHHPRVNQRTFQLQSPRIFATFPDSGGGPCSLCIFHRKLSSSNLPDPDMEKAKSYESEQCKGSPEEESAKDLIALAQEFDVPEKLRQSLPEGFFGALKVMRISRSIDPFSFTFKPFNHN